MKSLTVAMAVAMAINSALALPSPEDRKKACSESPNSVWVEQTGACIQGNPCESDNPRIKKAYCIEKIGWPVGDTAVRKEIVTEYVENVLSGKIAKMSEIQTTSSTYSKPVETIAVKTTDGRYVVIMNLMGAGVEPYEGEMTLYKAIQMAASAYGVECPYYREVTPWANKNYKTYNIYCETYSTRTCWQIKAFAEKKIVKKMTFMTNMNELDDFAIDNDLRCVINVSAGDFYGPWE